MEPTRLSQAPYGYCLDEKGGLLINPEEAKVVRKIFGDFLSGKSIREIANELAQAQVPKLKGNPVWSATGVSYILTNERYMGDELFQKCFTTDAFPFRKVKNCGEKSQFYVENTHEAIVSPNVFRLAKEFLKKKKSTSWTEKGNPNLYFLQNAGVQRMWEHILQAGNQSWNCSMGLLSAFP
jgi:site-specific DNA recombinase